jgi:cytochrome c oxidase subunit IV
MESVHSTTSQAHAALDVSSAGPADTAHAVPLRILLTVFIALLALTYVTVAARSIDLGGLNIWIALGIATLKGTLVILYFMHLRYDSPFYSIVLVTALVFMFLFLGVTMLDTVQYQPTIDEMMQSP